MQGNNWMLFVLVGVLVAIACWSLLYGLIWLFRSSDARVRARVKRFVVQEGEDAVTEAQESRQLRDSLFSQMDSRISERSFLKASFQRLSNEISKADLHLTVTEFLLIQVSVSIGLALILWLVAPSQVFAFLLAPIGFLAALLLARSYLRSLGKRRISKFEDQLPDTLSILASSVRGGFSLFQALQLIAKEASEPSKSEFLRVMQQVSLGAEMDDALAGLAKRIPTEDVDILVTAIGLQHQTGGNLAHVLDIVATTVRERHRVEREIRGLTAQQRFSAILLGAMPFLLAGLLYLISPAYISRMFVWSWVLCMPVGAIVLSVIGMIIMRRISSIDV
ncbi:MAG: type II secretion system F family protein [Chloroflexota bacterium]